MKASKNIKIALIVVLGALIVVALAAWQRGGTVASLWSERPPVARRELQELDKKIKPVAERRAKIREQLNKIESKEQEARDAAAAALKSMSSGERASVEQDMRAGKLSSENAKKRAAVVAFSEYQQAYSLRRQTQALRDGLEKYEPDCSRSPNAIGSEQQLRWSRRWDTTRKTPPRGIDYDCSTILPRRPTIRSPAGGATPALTLEDAAESSADDRAPNWSRRFEGRTVAETSLFEDELSA